MWVPVYPVVYIAHDAPPCCPLQCCGLAKELSRLVNSYVCGIADVAEPLQEALGAMAADPAASPAAQRRAAALLPSCEALLRQLELELAIMTELQELPSEQADAAQSMVAGVKLLEQRCGGGDEDARAALGRAGARWREAAVRGVAKAVQQAGSLPGVMRGMTRRVARALTVLETAGQVWPEVDSLRAVLAGGST